jgi:hypothetical protein
VETQEQTETVPSRDRSPLCLDTGHLAYRHADNVAIIAGLPAEQDMHPADFDKPKPIAQRTYHYLRSVGIGQNHQDGGEQS